MRASRSIRRGDQNPELFAQFHADARRPEALGLPPPKDTCWGFRQNLRAERTGELRSLLHGLTHGPPPRQPGSSDGTHPLKLAIAIEEAARAGVKVLVDLPEWTNRFFLPHRSARPPRLQKACQPAVKIAWPNRPARIYPPVLRNAQAGTAMHGQYEIRCSRPSPGKRKRRSSSIGGCERCLLTV